MKFQKPQHAIYNNIFKTERWRWLKAKDGKMLTWLTLMDRTRVAPLIADTFPVSAFTPSLILIYEDLELGTTNERELMVVMVFVFPDMHYFT